MVVIVQYSSTYIHWVFLKLRRMNVYAFAHTFLRIYFIFILFDMYFFFGLVQQVVPPNLCSLSGCSLYGTS